MRYPRAVVGIIVAALGVHSQALAAGARPWLCREKPVFSSGNAMTYQATNRGSSRWLLTFMRFDPSGLGHDGFTVLSTQNLAVHSEGRLEPGQWYAVALYRAGNHWICPGNARKSDEPAVISSLCYGKDAGDCTVKLTVRRR